MTSGAELKAAREAAEVSQEMVARLMEVATKTVQRMEAAPEVKNRDAHAFMAALARIASQSPDIVVPRGTLVSEPVAGYGIQDAWSPNPALKNAIPDRAYRVAIDYCRRLVAAGLVREEIETLERVMIDSRYAKANRRAGRELSDDDWILLVDDAWDAIRETLAGQGVRV